MHKSIDELFRNTDYLSSSAGNAELISLLAGNQAHEGTTQGTTEPQHDLQTLPSFTSEATLSTPRALSQSPEAASATTGGFGGVVADLATSIMPGGGGGGSLASTLLGGGGLLGDGLGLLFGGLTSLFGGGDDTPPPPTQYDAPAAQDFQLATSKGKLFDNVDDAAGLSRPASVTELALSGLQSSSQSGTPGVAGSPTSSSTGGSTQITVQVNAMDSQSFLDHSADIAQAVREAMLNMHSINDVVNDL